MARKDACSWRSRWVMVLVPMSVFVAACGGGDGLGPELRAPVITVSGVADGAVLDGPVTVVIDVDVGTYSATLNGAPFLSGMTVSASGSYTLEVTARNGEATSSASLAFEVRIGGPGVLIVRVIDLGPNEAGGGGDAILVTDSTEAGQSHLLLDAGPAGTGGADRGFVQRRLDQLGVDTLEALVLSHAHADHFDGMADVLRQVHVRAFYYNGQVRSFARYEEVLDLASTQAEQRVVVQSIVELTLGHGGATTLRLLPPISTALGDTDDSTLLNNGSLGLRLTRGSFSMFFAGDGEVAANERWRTTYAGETRDVTALKVGHHGANDAVFDDGSSGSSTWITHATPRLQIVSANGTSHPRLRATAHLLSRSTATTVCTNVHGDIEVRVDAAGGYQVTTERNEGALCQAGTNADT